MRRIPLCIPAIGEEEKVAVLEALESGVLSHGSKNKEFEALFQDYLPVKHAISMNSCASALFLAVAALDIKGEIIVPSFTFMASLNAIVTGGAVPVLADIDPDTRNISVASIQAAITDRTEAIMVVHFAGLPADMPAIIELAERHNLRIIEDSAESLGGSYHGVKTGTYDIGCFSFWPTKNITTGEGGMFTTSDTELAGKVRALIAHGVDKQYFQRETEQKPWLRIASSFGYNFRMSNLLAAIGVEQMKKLDPFNRTRNEIAGKFIAMIHNEAVTFQHVPEDYFNAWQMFTIRVPAHLRDGLVTKLKQQGVEASVHFDPPAHLQPIYKPFVRVPLPHTEAVSASIITLPIFPGMSDDDLAYICEVINGFEGLA